MNENITGQVETEATFTEAEAAAFDEGWEDSDSPILENSANDTEYDDTDAQPEFDETGEDVEEPDSTDEAETEAEPEPEDEAGSQRFNLTFLGEDREVSLEEMRELAQKGLNYDHVKEERDNLRTKTANLDELESYSAFLKELADNGGMSVDELMDSTRARLLVQKAESEGRDLSEDEALRQVKESKKQPAPAPEKTREERQTEAINRFIAMYPDVKSSDIPQSVWDEAEKIGDILAPYQKYEAQKLRDEIAQLKQNQKNRERSTGSRRTVGATTPKDAFDEGWDSLF